MTASSATGAVDTIMSAHRAVVAATRHADRYGFELRRADGTLCGRMAAMNARLANDAHVLESLSTWRNRNTGFFLTTFENTPEKARAWLNSAVLPDPDRLPFLIYSPDDVLIGNNGLSHIGQREAELDTMMRGASGGSPDLMKMAELHLLHWMFAVLGLDLAFGNVMSHNALVRRFHGAIGFRETQKTGLRREETTEGHAFIPVPIDSPEAGQIHLIRIEISRDEFYEKHRWIEARLLPKP